MKLKQSLLLMAAGFFAMPASAQLSQNPNKFLGNITTRGQVEAGGGVPSYHTLWNQITCENESKWSSVEGTRGSFNWSGADRAFNYAQQHNFTHKFHALIWGAQYPNWLESLSPKERFSAITNWFDHAKEHYKTLPMIDVVNEAVGNHQPGNPMMKASLGGGGKTGYDWLIKAFEMAYERWPDAILIYNDYNSIRWNVNEYIDLVKTLRNAGAPIDAYGNQSHELSDISTTELSRVLKQQQDALQMPMFITELDIANANDNQQKAQYEAILPLMWEAPYCAGVTLWGYVLGATWVDNTGLYRNGTERPAMTWIKEYMQTDAAKNAVGPFPGTKKEASVYIRPAALKVAKDDPLPIKVHARLATKTIEKVELYANDELVATMTEAPYVTDYVAATTGMKNLKAVVTATDGSTYERFSTITVTRGTQRSPYNDETPKLPGVINANEYDKGLSGVAFSANASRSTTTATSDDAWMEYTVDVQEEGYYSVDVEVASTKDDGRFHLSEYTLDNIIFYTDFTEVPNTGSKDTFKSVHCPLKQYLTAGRHVFCMNVDKGGFYIKTITFKHTPTFSLPGVVEGEDYLTSENVGAVTAGDGFALGNTVAGGWAEYVVNVTQPGKYSYEATVSSAVDNASFSMTLINNDGSEKTLGSLIVPNTGSNDTYTIKTAKIRNTLKEAGEHTLRIKVTNAGGNIDNIKFICTEPATGISEIADDDNAVVGNMYNLYGMPVTSGYRGIAIQNGKKLIIK